MPPITIRSPITRPISRSWPRPGADRHPGERSHDPRPSFITTRIPWNCGPASSETEPSSRPPTPYRRCSRPAGRRTREPPFKSTIPGPATWATSTTLNLDQESAATAMPELNLDFDLLEVLNGPYFFSSNQAAIEDWFHLLNRGYGSPSSAPPTATASTARSRLFPHLCVRPGGKAEARSTGRPSSPLSRKAFLREPTVRSSALK